MIELNNKFETEDVNFYDKIPNKNLSFQDGLYEFIVNNIY